MQPTIVTLSPPTLDQDIATFEEAFGEYSEARGKGRKRRAAKKAKRRTKKTTRKSSRVAEKDKRKRTKTATKRKRKQDKRSGRIADRMSRRKQRKTGRMGARQDKRNLRMKSRMERKRTKADERSYRKSTRGRGDEDDYEEDYYPEEEGYDDEPYEQDGYGEDGYEDEYDDSGYDDDESYDDGGYDDYDDDYDDGGYDDYDDDYDDGGYDDYDDGMSDDEWADEPYDNYGDDDWGYFDATSGADGQTTVNPRIQKITDKVEFNKERLSRLRMKLQRVEMGSQRSRDLETKVNKTTNRISWLETKLARFMDNAKDGHRESRRRHIGHAKRKSIGQRKALHQRALLRQRGEEVSPDETTIDSELNPNIEEQRISIPAASNSNGPTGINAIDLQEDEDSPNARYVELVSNVDGDKEKKKIPLKPILIGVGIAAVVITAIILIKKSKKK